MSMGLLKWTLTFDYNTINKVKKVSLNLSLSSGSLKDLMEIFDLYCHQIVQSLALLSSLVTSLFKTAEIKHYLHHKNHSKYKLTHFKTFNLSIDPASHWILPCSTHHQWCMQVSLFHCKNICVTSTIFRSSQLHACCVCDMLQTSKDTSNLIQSLSVVEKLLLFVKLGSCWKP